MANNVLAQAMEALSVARNANRGYQVPRADSSRKANKADIVALLEQQSLTADNIFKLSKAFLPLYEDFSNRFTLDQPTDFGLWMAFYWWTVKKFDEMTSTSVTQQDALAYLVGYDCRRSRMTPIMATDKEKRLLDQFDSDTLTKLMGMAQLVKKHLMKRFGSVRLPSVDDDSCDEDDDDDEDEDAKNDRESLKAEELEELANSLPSGPRGHEIVAGILVMDSKEMQEFIDGNDPAVFEQRRKFYIDAACACVLNHRRNANPTASATTSREPTS